MVPSNVDWRHNASALAPLSLAGRGAGGEGQTFRLRLITFCCAPVVYCLAITRVVKAEKEQSQVENIFISHIHEEAPLAKVFKEELEATSVGQWQVFVSSDKGSVTLGDQWFSKIDDALTGHSLLLVLCSPVSLSRLWIGYEVGYAAAKGVPIIPICHSGMKPDKTPSFLSRYQGVQLDADDFVTQLFEAIQKHVPLPRNPRIPVQEIENAIKAALAQIALQPVIVPIDTTSPNEDILGDKRCAELLQMMALSTVECWSLEDIVRCAELSKPRAEHYVGLLLNKRFLYMTECPTVMDEDEMGYALSHTGTEFLVNNDLV